MPKQTHAASVRYRTIVADPPWHYDGFPRGGQNHRKRDGSKRSHEEQGPVVHIPVPYSTMTVEEIAALPLREIAAADCRFFLWATMRYLPEALRLIAGWDFSYKQLLVWDKTPFFSPLGGSVAPNACEFLIVSTRGNPARMGRWNTSIVRDDRKARSTHSRKPDVFLDLVEQVSPGPYLELFSRRARLGWDTWGDEALGTAELIA